MHFFYSSEIINGEIVLRDQEWQHLSKSMRMKIGDDLWVLDGAGHKYHAILTRLDKKIAIAEIRHTWQSSSPTGTLHLAIAPTKNINRMEWLLEKATELGLAHMTFLETRRTERTRINLERMQKIAVSAMKQSANVYLPVVSDLQPLPAFLRSLSGDSCRLVAHCQSENLPHLADLLQPGMKSVVLIGPEGDFTRDEIDLCGEHGFQEISLGQMRLRTETAGIFVTSMNAIVNRY